MGPHGCVDCYECFEAAERDQRELNVRPYAVGLARPGEVSTATAVFVVLALATVTFDGLTATPAWVDLQTAVYSTAGLIGTNTVQTIETAGLLLLAIVFIAVYLGFSWAIRELSGEQVAVRDVARAFVFSLVPIALAYNMAHFISLLLIQGQLIVPLASDPFGYGWGPFRHRRLPDRHRGDQRQDRLVHLGGGDSAGAYHRRVRRPRCNR